jgi:hypothetical protein
MAQPSFVDVSVVERRHRGYPHSGASPHFLVHIFVTPLLLSPVVESPRYPEDFQHTPIILMISYTAFWEFLSNCKSSSLTRVDKKEGENILNSEASASSMEKCRLRLNTHAPIKP